MDRALSPVRVPAFASRQGAKQRLQQVCHFSDRHYSRCQLSCASAAGAQAALTSRPRKQDQHNNRVDHAEDYHTNSKRPVHDPHGSTHLRQGLGLERLLPGLDCRLLLLLLGGLLADLALLKLPLAVGFHHLLKLLLLGGKHGPMADCIARPNPEQIPHLSVAPGLEKKYLEALACFRGRSHILEC